MGDISKGVANKLYKKKILCNSTDLVLLLGSDGGELGGKAQRHSLSRINISCNSTDLIFFLRSDGSELCGQTKRHSLSRTNICATLLTSYFSSGATAASWVGKLSAIRSSRDLVGFSPHNTTRFTPVSPLYKT